MDFKIGDKVECIDNICVESLVDVGSVYTVFRETHKTEGQIKMVGIVTKDGKEKLLNIRFKLANEETTKNAIIEILKIKHTDTVKENLSSKDIADDWTRGYLAGHQSAYEVLLHELGINSNTIYETKFKEVVYSLIKEDA